MRTSAFLLGVALMSCGPGKADKFDEILAQLDKLKTEMCACKDLACADRVMDARREYKKTMRDKLDKDAKPTEAQDKQGKAVEAELQACRKALRNADESAAGSADAAD